MRADKSWIITFLKAGFSYTEIKKASLKELSFLLNLQIEYAKEEEKKLKESQQSD